MTDIYIETSVWSHAIADDAPESRKAVLTLLDLVHQGRYRASYPM